MQIELNSETVIEKSSVEPWSSFRFSKIPYHSATFHMRLAAHLEKLPWHRSADSRKCRTVRLTERKCQMKSLDLHMVVPPDTSRAWR